VSVLTTIHTVHFSSRPGGIEVLMPALIEGLSGLDIRLFVIRPPRKGDVSVYSHLEKDRVTYGARYNIWGLLTLYLYLIKNRNDIFHLYNTGPYVLLLLRLAGIKKIVYSIRGTKYWKKPWQTLIRKISWRLGLNEMVRIIANSNFSRSVFLNEISDRFHVEVVYNPVYRTNRFRNIRNNSNKGLTIIYVGRLASGKNLFKWLDVAKTIHNNLRNVNFKLYGDGPLINKLMTYSEKLEINSFVEFMGFTSDINLAYNHADLMIFLSEYESFGNVVVESILCGTPVIASSIPSMKEIFQNYPEFLVEMDESLDDVILNKILNITHLKDIALAAKEEFKQRYSLDQHIEKLNSIYQFTD